MSNPYESPSYGYDPTSGGEFQRPKGIIPSGLVQQARIVAILNMVQGGLELLFALMLFGIAVMMLTMSENPELRRAMEQGQDPAAREFMPYLWIVYGGLGVVLLGTSIFRIVAGLSNWRFRGRGMGIASLIVGLLSSVACYCLPTGIAIFVYGLVVYLNPSVVQAFQMGAEGVPGDRILFEFSPYRDNTSYTS